MHAVMFPTLLLRSSAANIKLLSPVSHPAMCPLTGICQWRRLTELMSPVSRFEILCRGTVGPVYRTRSFAYLQLLIHWETHPSLPPGFLSD